MIKEILQFLDNEFSELTYNPDSTGGNLFDSNLPPEPDIAVQITGTGGSESDTGMPQYKPGRFQVLTRGDTDPSTARDLAEKIGDKLNGLASTKFIPYGLRVVSCQAVNARPEYLGRDDNNRCKFTQNFEVETQE